MINKFYDIRRPFGTNSEDTYLAIISQGDDVGVFWVKTPMFSMGKPSPTDFFEEALDEMTQLASAASGKKVSNSWEMYDDHIEELDSEGNMLRAKFGNHQDADLTVTLMLSV